MPLVLVYADAGASGPCISFAEAGLTAEANVEVKRCDAEFVRAGDFSQVDLLVMPGGADRPYMQALAGIGNANIRRFVEAGGRYLGLCAGAYYACSTCVFARDDAALSVVEPRELCFFPGSGEGPAFPGFAYASEAGAVICGVRLESAQAGSCRGAGGEDSVGAAYCNGGPAFIADGDGGSAVRVLARYADGEFEGRPAAVTCAVGRGVAVLVGPHPEFTAAGLQSDEYAARGGAGAADGAGEQGAGVERLRRAALASALAAADQRRARFWRSVLSEALPRATGDGR